MNQEQTSQPEFTQMVNAGHTDLIRDRFGNKYFSEVKIVNNQERGVLDLNKVWESREKLALGVALDSLAQELRTNVTSIGTLFGTIDGYFDKMTDDSIVTKFNQAQGFIEQAAQTYEKAEEVHHAAAFMFSHLRNLNENSAIGPEPEKFTSDYDHLFAQWKLKYGFIALTSALGEYQKNRPIYTDQSQKIAVRMADRGLTVPS